MVKMRKKTVSRTSKSYIRPSYSINRQQRYVPRVVGNPLSLSETKYFTAYGQFQLPYLAANWNPASVADGNAGTVFYPLQGTAYNQRVGRKIMVKKISLKVQIVQPPSQSVNINNGVAPSYRMILFVDKQTNAIQATGSALMDPNGPTITAYQNPINFGRFKVLRDIQATMSNPNISQSASIDRSGYTRYFKITYKFKKPLVVNYNQTNGGTIADVVDNSFHFFVGTDIDVYQLTSVYVNCNYTCRTTFCDP